MKIFALLVLLLAVAITIYFYILGGKSKAGKPPGLVNGQLSQCGGKPNCVCSEQADNNDFFIEPLALGDQVSDPLAAMKTVIESLGGVVNQQTDDYLAATFTSKFFGFTDDLEVRVDPGKALHLRSASRVGHSDFGANRQRLEQLVASYNNQTK